MPRPIPVGQITYIHNLNSRPIVYAVLMLSADRTRPNAAPGRIVARMVGPTTVQSTINRSHNPIRITIPSDFSWGQRIIKPLHLGRIKPECGRGHILLKIVPVLSAGDWHDIVALLQ